MSSAASDGSGEKDWDPLALAQRQVSVKFPLSCLRRVSAEVAELKKEPLPGAFVCPDENIATLVHALLQGPEGTPYELGLFHFVIYAKPNYPHEPPLARLMTTGKGQVRFNPQFYTSGKVCLSILHTWPGPSWNPSFTLRVVVLQLQALMNEMPALNEPGVMIMSNPEDYNAYLRHETLRAALQIYQEAEAEEQAMPRELAEQVCELVRQNAGKLEARCRDLAAQVPDKTLLPGVPSGVQANYSGMAQHFRSLRPDAEREEEVEEAECRICGSGREDGELLEPCGCSGSMAHVHRACAAEWIRRNNSPLCPICGQAYSDRKLRALGMMGRYKLRCQELGKFFRCLGIAVACLLLHLASSSGLPVEIAPWELHRWQVQPAPRRPEAEALAKARQERLNRWTASDPPKRSEPMEESVFWEPDDGNVKDYRFTPPYRIRGTWLLPALHLREKWREPLVEELIFHPLTPWSSRTLPVPVRFEAMVRHLQEARLFPQRPRGLRRVMDHWEAQMAQEQVRRQGSRQEPSDTKGRGRGHIGVAARLRCRLRAAVEPAPSVTVRLRPPYAAEVAALVVLFAWQAVGARPFFWILLCCQLGSLWFPFPLVAAGAVSANLLRYQVKRRLARLNMLRMRPQMEGDLLIFALLILGACCAGNGYGSLRKDLLPALRARTGAIPLQRQEAGGIMAWVLLVLVALIAMATVAKRPSEGEQGLVLAPLLHGALWAAAGAALCLLAAAPMFA